MSLNTWKTASALVLLAGCATAQKMSAPPAASIAPGVTFTLPTHPPFEEPLIAQQLVRAHYGDEHLVFQAAIEADNGRFRLVISLPSGPSVMHVDWGPDGVSSTMTPLATAAFSERALLADLIIVYAPYAVLRKALSESEATIVDGETRVILKEGEPIVRVSLPVGDPWEGTTQFENLAYGYELEISSRRF